ncbi:hypothetical protein QL285_020727 [Trifolium repens]|jgi:hypothetical protein|nr:hypothetical protein QL285_020727 [Trifolium repens]
MEYENQIGDEGYKFTTSVFLLHLSHFILSRRSALPLSFNVLELFENRDENSSPPAKERRRLQFLVAVSGGWHDGATAGTLNHYQNQTFIN